LAYEPPPRQIESVLRLCTLSLDPATDGFPMQRFLQWTVWVDAEKPEQTRDVFDRVVSLAIDEIKANDCSPLDDLVWGPFDGSRWISLFGKSNDEPDGRSFRERLRRIAGRVRDRIGALPKGVRVVLIVGSSAITIAGSSATAAAAASTFNIPAVYAQVIVIGNTVVNATDSLRKVFQDNHPATAKEEPAPTRTVPPPETTASEERPHDGSGRTTQDLFGLSDEEFELIRQQRELLKRRIAGKISTPPAS